MEAENQPKATYMELVNNQNLSAEQISLEHIEVPLYAQCDKFSMNTHSIFNDGCNTSLRGNANGNDSIMALSNQNVDIKDLVQ
jgi:hypothetical protein